MGYKYRSFFQWITFSGFCAVFMFAVYTFGQAIPDTIYVAEGEELTYDFHVPVTVELQDASMEASIQSGAAKYRGSYEVLCKLFGIFPVKNIEVFVVNNENLYAGGMPIGIYIETDGILVMDTGTVAKADGTKVSPSESVLQAGDYILSVDGEVTESKEQLMYQIQESTSERIVLGIRRKGAYLETVVQPVTGDDGVQRIGVWVKDDLAGIGTLTYYRKEGVFAALGHAISEADVGESLQIKNGRIYTTNIIGIKKGEKGTPGELSGVITYQESNVLGTIEKNSELGIYGQTNENFDAYSGKQSYGICYKQDIEMEKAYILSSMIGEQQAYEIKIESLDFSGREKNKGILFQVTDERLLALTGGIVQGMSGSPIIQDGKIIGAVTHVLVNDPTRGYGIFIENMLAIAG